MKKILFADDDSAIQDVMSLMFEDEYEVVSCMNGDSLLKSISVMPDLFLIDKQLAGANGLDICQFLKMQPETMNIPVIIISASPDIAGEARQAGADDVIQKPFNIKEVRAMVKRYMDAANKTLP
jgi:CheY-like chemotaxis protein